MSHVNNGETPETTRNGTPWVFLVSCCCSRAGTVCRSIGCPRFFLGAFHHDKFSSRLRIVHTHTAAAKRSMKGRNFGATLWLFASSTGFHENEQMDPCRLLFLPCFLSRFPMMHSHSMNRFLSTCLSFRLSVDTTCTLHTFCQPMPHIYSNPLAKMDTITLRRRSHTLLNLVVM